MLTRRERTPLRKLMLLGAMAGAGALVEDTATGNPLTFITDKAKPLKSLLIPFTPQQEGTGDPSPSNIRSVIPWNGLTVFGGGKNFLNPATLEQGGIESAGTEFNSAKRVRSGYIPVKENEKYIVSAGTGTKTFMHFYDANKGSLGANTGASATSPEGSAFVRCIVGYTDESDIAPSDITTGQLELGQTATAYEPYKPITETDIVFPSAVYGGTLDVVSGVLTVQWASADIGSFKYSLDKTLTGVDRFYINNFPNRKQNDETLALYSDVFKWEKIGDANRNFDTWVVCPLNARMYYYVPAGIYETPSDFETAMSGKQIVYELASPQTVQLTPAQITALIGNNTIWSDADGQMTAVYLKKG